MLSLCLLTPIASSIPFAFSILSGLSSGWQFGTRLEGLHGEGPFSKLLCPANSPGSTVRAVPAWMVSSDQLLYQNHKSMCVRRLFSCRTGPFTPSTPEELPGGCSVARRSVAEQRVTLGHRVTCLFSPGHLSLFTSYRPICLHSGPTSTLQFLLHPKKEGWGGGGHGLLSSCLSSSTGDGWRGAASRGVSQEMVRR